MKILSKLKKTSFDKHSLKKINESPGIYVFFDVNNTPIYIGKSINLRNRVQSYVNFPLSPKTHKMVSEVANFSTIEVLSELEALLLEAKLIKTFKPNYNIELKDDKNPLYIRISKEKYPKVLFARKIDEAKFAKENIAFFGPFPSSSNTKVVIKAIRRVFPFSQHKIGKRLCLYAQIGLCDPCPNEIETIENEFSKHALIKKYKKNIKNVIRVLNGDFQKIREDLNNQMKAFAKSQDFENAQQVKQQIERLEYITQPFNRPMDYIVNPNLKEDVKGKELNELKNILDKYFDFNNFARIECFDIAHLQGTKPTASMVTFVDGEADKNLYRRFKIFQNKGNDDISSLQEVATRRLKHINDWGKPDLIIVDGGRGQSAVFNTVFSQIAIPVVGIAKRFETLIIPTKHIVNPFAEVRLKNGHAKNLVQRMRNEAHRFARRYHHHLIKKGLFS